MRAIGVLPGHPGSAAVIDVADPPLSDGAVLVRGRVVGICGTDAEIVYDGYGTVPEGADRLVLGHESLGEVVEARPPATWSQGLCAARIRNHARAARPVNGTCAATGASWNAA